MFQIGDVIMCYILMHSSVFLPVKKRDYLQVTGVPLNIVLRKRIYSSITARNQQARSIKAKCHTVIIFYSDLVVTDKFSLDTCPLMPT